MRERVARGEGVEVISNVNAQRSAVRSIAWLGPFMVAEGSILLPSFLVLRSAPLQRHAGVRR